MDPETFNSISGDAYRIVVMLIEGFTPIVGLASVMFMLGAAVCAIGDFLDGMRRSSRHQNRPPTRAYESSGLANFECATTETPRHLHPFQEL